MKRQQIEQLCIDALEHNKAKFQTVRDKWQELVKRYENQLREGSISAETEAKITLGQAYSLVENAIPRLLSRQPKYRYLARGREDSEASELYEEFSNYQWEQAECQSELKVLAKWALITGFAGWKMGWKEEKRVYKKRTKEILGVEITNRLLEPFAKTQIKSIEDVTSNYTFDSIKPFDMVWSPDADNPNDARILGYKMRKTIRQLKVEGYDTRNLVSTIYNSDHWQDQMDQDSGVTNYQKSRLMEDINVEIAELWTKILDCDGVYKFNLVTVATFGEENYKVIKFEDNPFDEQFRPVGVFRPVLRPGKMYGFGVIEPTLGVLDAEEDLLNITIETLHTDLARPMEFNPQNVVAPNEVRYGSRVLIPVRQLGASVNVLPTPSPNIQAVSYVNEYLTRSRQNISAITDYQTGSEQIGGAKTLGEVQIKTQESNARLQMMLDSLEKDTLEPMGKYALMMNKQYLSENKSIFYRILGKKGKIAEKSIKFKDIDAVKDIIIVSGSSSLIVQQAELNKWSALLNQAYLEARQPGPVPINRERIWERLLEQGVLIKDVENFLPSVKEREEAEMSGKEYQINDAKNENANPLTARVMPTDDPQVHIPLHKSEIEAREREIMATQGQASPLKLEEMQMLIQHYNDHAIAVGGMVPQFSQGMGVGQPGVIGAEPNVGENNGVPPSGVAV